MKQKIICPPDCERRCVGCHNPKTCEDWKKHLEEKEIEDARKAEYIEKSGVNKGYIAESKERIVKRGLKLHNNKSNRHYR